MAIRRFLLLNAAVSLALSTVVFPPILRAEEPADAQDVETAKHNFIGVINVPTTFVRSQARDDAYPTVKLEAGQKVTVVGIRLKWLKIVPPDGSFAYVPKAYVNQRGDGRIGRTTHEISAKVGSTLNPLKTAAMATIPEGQDIEILGDQDEYWKVKPPEGSVLFVNKSDVDPLMALPSPAEQKTQEIAAVGAHKTHESAVAGANEGSGPLTTVTPAPVAPAPATTQPSETAIAFDKLESDFKDANEKPITDQPIETLLSSYQNILAQNGLIGQDRKIAEIRISTLKLRAEAKTEFLALKDTQQQAADRQKALVAEREEIQQRIKEKEVTMFAAVGTLRASSIQRGSGTLYRLTDPTTGRSVAYIRSNDTKYAGMLGQFVGVRGDITTDDALNIKQIESPTDVEVVDPAKVNNSIAAQIVPPSLMPGIHTASSAE